MGSWFQLYTRASFPEDVASSPRGQIGAQFSPLSSSRGDGDTAAASARARAVSYYARGRDPTFAIILHRSAIILGCLLLLLHSSWGFSCSCISSRLVFSHLLPSLDLCFSSSMVCAYWLQVRERVIMYFEYYSVSRSIILIESLLWIYPDLVIIILQ